MKFKGLVVIVLFILTLLTLNSLFASSVSSFPNRSFELENGLRFFLEKKDTLPLVHIVLSFKVGAKDAVVGNSGAVHLLEHLIFSHDNRKPGAMENAGHFGSLGVLFNAKTSHDLMTLEFTAPPNRLGDTLKIIRDRVFGMQLDSTKIAKEKEIIFEEIAENEASPLEVGYELLFRELFDGHAYAHSIGGSRELLAKVTIDDLNSLKETYLTPNNCTMVLVGNVHVAGTTRIVNTLFGSLKKANPAPNSGKNKLGIPTLLKNKFVEKTMTANEGYLIIGFPAPGKLHKDGTGLRVLAEIMSDGGGGLLTQRLNQSRSLVKGSLMSYHPLEAGGALVICIIAKPRNFKKIQKKLFGFLNKDAKWLDYTRSDYLFGSSIITISHLGNTVNALLLEYCQSLEKGLDRAGFYSHQLLYYSNGSFQGLGDRLKKVNSKYLQQMAARYLSKKNYVVVSLLPDKQ